SVLRREPRSESLRQWAVRPCRILGRALEDDDLVAALEVYGDGGILREIARAPRRRAALEVESAVGAAGPRRHRVWPAVGPCCREPVVERRFEKPGRPGPRQQPLFGFRNAVSLRHRRPTGLGLASQLSAFVIATSVRWSSSSDGRRLP